MRQAELHVLRHGQGAGCLLSEGTTIGPLTVIDVSMTSARLVPAADSGGDTFRCRNRDGEATAFDRSPKQSRLKTKRSAVLDMSMVDAESSTTEIACEQSDSSGGLRKCQADGQVMSTVCAFRVAALDDVAVHHKLTSERKIRFDVQQSRSFRANSLP